MATALRAGIPPAEVPEAYLVAHRWARDPLGAAA
jgi:hypothetical protein